MYEQSLVKTIQDHIKPKVLKETIGIKNGSMVMMLNTIS